MSPLLTPEEVGYLKERCDQTRRDGVAYGMAKPWNVIAAVEHVEGAVKAAEILPLLAEALGWLLGDPDPIQRFEDRAEAFYRETRIMAPGKDMAAASGGTDDYDERRRVWQAWIDKNTEAARAALEAYRQALGEAKE